MFRRLLRRLVGIDKVEQELEELKKKQELSGATRSDLEKRVIESEELKRLIKADVAQANLSRKTTTFLEGLGIQITNSTRDAAFMAMQVAELAERYGFRRFVPPTEDQYPKSVITIRDLQEHPEKYIHKLNKGMMNFPVGLNFEG